ncbi:hypothetical protein V5J73_04525 [Flavobacterium sp. KS-LB2]|uniref:hypothetical protein n=1 Tax=Flavobacterium sp. KS-LB2 TaxID=3120525 RepID=UPI0030CF0F47
MREYTKEEFEKLLEEAIQDLNTFKTETLASLKETLKNLPEKYKKDTSYREYLHSKNLVTDFINNRYPKTDEYFNGVFVQYTVDTYIFFNLVSVIPTIHNEFEEFYMAYFEETFHDIQP